MADRIIYSLSLFIAMGTIKKISQSLGSQHLKGTFEEIFDITDNVSKSLIDISINLDHLSSIPHLKITRLYKRIEKNRFSSTILRMLVYMHFYMYDCKFNIKQALCDKLNIQLKGPAMLRKKS